MAKKKDFGTILTELEEVIGKIESGDLSLEAALKEFQTGVGLVAEGEKQLRGAEAEVEKGEALMNSLFPEEDTWR
ncbi:MAG: exodeoxyribonuclease VII small subunit [Peptococcaceae bacterium]|jgi:exodeoxyribonuclease VII small subunit|nr:exodeoxyribonuclease VII small subunit [Peptococcaceae bacterium]